MAASPTTTLTFSSPRLTLMVLLSNIFLFVCLSICLCACLCVHNDDGDDVNWVVCLGQMVSI